MLLKCCISVSKQRLGSFQWAQPECSLCPTVQPSNSLAFHFTGFWPNTSAGYCKSTPVTHPFVRPLLPPPNMQSPCVREWQGGRKERGFCTWQPESGLNTCWLPIYLTYIKSFLSYSHPVPLSPGINRSFYQTKRAFTNNKGCLSCFRWLICPAVL